MLPPSSVFLYINFLYNCDEPKLYAVHTPDLNAFLFRMEIPTPQFPLFSHTTRCFWTPHHSRLLSLIFFPFFHAFPGGHNTRGVSTNQIDCFHQYFPLPFFGVSPLVPQAVPFCFFLISFYTPLFVPPECGNQLKKKVRPCPYFFSKVPPPRSSYGTPSPVMLICPSDSPPFFFFSL